MGDVVYRPRESFSLPPPVNNSGSPRPLLNPLRPIITCHYPGAPLGKSYVGMGELAKRTYIFDMQRYAQAAGKSYEYNFVLFLDGEIWEYAGDYLAAHSEGENTIAYGVQFVNGQDDLATDAQVEAFRWLRDVHLKGRGRVSADCATTPHKLMPGAVTACPGDRAVMPRLADLRKPYETAPPEPAEEGEVTSFRILVLEDADDAAVLLDGFTGRWLDPERYNAYHYFYPKIVDEPAAKSWLTNVTMLGALPPGVTPDDIWGHQPDAG